MNVQDPKWRLGRRVVRAIFERSKAYVTQNISWLDPVRIPRCLLVPFPSRDLILLLFGCLMLPRLVHLHSFILDR